MLFIQCLIDPIEAAPPAVRAGAARGIRGCAAGTRAAMRRAGCAVDARPTKAARMTRSIGRGAQMDSINLKDTAAWRFQVVSAFVLAIVLTTGGVLYMPANPWVKGYLMMGFYFTVSSAFSLAKSLRDAHESSRIVAKISEAKTEKMLRELAQS